jgi:hypothetical protein
MVQRGKVGVVEVGVMVGGGDTSASNDRCHDIKCTIELPCRGEESGVEGGE